MINILILAAGGSAGQDHQVPTCLTEIADRPLLQLITENCLKISGAQLIYAVKEQDVKTFSLDKVCNILDSQSKVIQIKHSTMGAACTALLACEYIDNEDELLIVATNELLKIDFDQVVK